MTYQLGNQEDNTRAYSSILEGLLGERVLEIKPKPEGFRVREQCDDYFYVYLTRDQMLTLADEIRVMADLPLPAKKEP